MLFDLIFNVTNILAGILLGITALDKLDGESNFFNNIAKKVMPFTTIIGGIALGFGIVNVLSFENFLYSIIAILGGILLLTHVLSQIPTIGSALVKFSKKLMPFKVIVGMALLVFAVLYLF